MNRLACVSLMSFCAAFAWGADWITDGGDGQRTGWQKDEKVLNKDSVRNMKLLWKVQTGNAPRALHALMPPVITTVNTPSGRKEMAILSGISDNIYGIDALTGKIVWQHHYSYTPPPGRDGGPAPTDPGEMGFLGPGGSSDVPVIGPPNPSGTRPLYFVSGDGMLHTLNVADGEDLAPPFLFTTGKGWALNLNGNTIWMPHGRDLSAVHLDDPQHKVYTATAKSGGLWGRRGVAVDSTGTAWTTTGDGIYEPETQTYGNAVVGMHFENGELKIKDYYVPTNWVWLRKRDLDPNNTPTIFNYKGREIMAASGKECRVYLLDPRNVGGADHQTPLYKTPLFCNEEVDFQDAGSWGALSTWEEANGTHWVLAPFWGPVHSAYKAPVMNSPLPKEGGVAAFRVSDKNGQLTLDPAWVSRDMFRGEPVVIANGVVYGYGSGEETKQAWPDKGLFMQSSIRIQRGTHATIYAMDALTGKELWNSGNQIASWNHFAGLSIANGRLYLGTYDGYLYCFGLAN
jgi:outer membrane protein assembly factor BamB